MLSVAAGSGREVNNLGAEFAGGQARSCPGAGRTRKARMKRGAARANMARALTKVSSVQARARFAMGVGPTMAYGAARHGHGEGDLRNV